MFFKNLSHVMPAYSAVEWIRYLLQIGTAIRQNLPNSNNQKPEEDSMDVDNEENADNENPYELVDEWNRRADPTVFDCALPIYSLNQSYTAILKTMPLLPGSVVNQILQPRGDSLLQLIMLNKLIQYYRLNKCYKQIILKTLLDAQPNPGYQNTVTQLFKYTTINQRYSLQDPQTRYISKFSIYLGAANLEFWGLLLGSTKWL
jgi:hypothetical protein